jgi:hypothetical protein
LGSIHQYNSRMVGRELSCKRVGPWISIRPTSLPLTLPFPLDSAPPLSHLLPPQALAATSTQNPSRPPLQGAALPLGSPLCGFELTIGVWREEEGRRKGRTQGEFVIIFCCLCAAIKLIMCLSIRIGRGAVQKFCGWANSSSSSDFWEFSWVN